MDRLTNFPNFLSAIKSSELNPVLFIEVEFDSGFTHIWSGIYDLLDQTFGSGWAAGAKWIAAGQLITVGAINETTGVEAVGAVITLTGIDPAFISLAITEARQNKAVNIWFGALDSSNTILDGVPYKFFSGFVDVVEISEEAESATVTIRAENKLSSLLRPRIRRYTSEDQKKIHPSDLGFDFVSQMSDWSGVWGVPIVIGATKPQITRESYEPQVNDSP